MSNIIGKTFNGILLTEVNTTITKAFNSLQQDMFCFGEVEAKEILDEKAEEMRKVVNCYIEEQKSTFHKIRDSFERIADIEGQVQSQQENKIDVDEIINKLDLKALGNELINLPKSCRINH